MNEAQIHYRLTFDYTGEPVWDVVKPMWDVVRYNTQDGKIYSEQKIGIIHNRGIIFYATYIWQHEAPQQVAVIGTYNDVAESYRAMCEYDRLISSTGV